VEGLGGYRALSSPAREVGTVVFLGTLCLTALLERLQFQLRASEASVWWASNGRDVVNAFALATLSLGLRVFGFTGPIALCIAATLIIAVSLVQSWLSNCRAAGVLTFVTALVLGEAVVLWPEGVHQLFRGLLERLFG
jgi:hypothetical protein